MEYGRLAIPTIRPNMIPNVIPNVRLDIRHLDHDLEDVTFHGRDHVRDDGRSIKERTFVIGCIAVTCKYHVRDVRSF